MTPVAESQAPLHPFIPARLEPPPRLLYLITRAERGGAQMHVLDLALAMREHFDVHVATGEEGFLTEAGREAGLGVHVLPHLEREIRPLADARGFVELLSLLRRLRPNLIHAHTFKAGFLGRLAAKSAGVASIYTVHMWPFGRAVPLSWRMVAPVCERLAAGWCNGIITVSELGAKIARQHSIGQPSQVTAILNGISDHPVRVVEHREQALSCTMVARFTAFKDHAVLLRAFAAVPCGVRLQLVGDGDTLAACQALAAELGIEQRVDFMGSRSDVPQILAETDVFVLASKTETLPISILEAMRAGLPVVASDVGGIHEEVVSGKTGILVPAGSVPELSKALTLLLADKGLRERMGAAGRERFERHFLAEQMVSRTRALYGQVLAACVQAP